jgi:hypothetical protein
MLSGGVIMEPRSSIGEDDDVLELGVGTVGVVVLLKALAKPIGFLEEEEVDNFLLGSPV